MAAILGVSALYHDAAAALVVDGAIVAAVQQERLSRIKNDPSVPLAAARACLRIGGLDAGALDAVVFYENPYAKLERVLDAVVRSFPRSFRQFPRAVADQLGDKLWVLDQLAEGLGVPRARVEHAEHHLCHAASAFLPSPFAEAAVLVVDGVGEHATTSIWHGREGTVMPVARIDYPHSIGLFYGALTSYLGFEVNEGEYKVMGLAAFGTPRYREALSKVVRLHEDASFELDPAYFDYRAAAEVGFSSRLEALLGPRRPHGRAWRLETDEDRRFADVAASVQAITEDALVALAREARRRTGADALCLAGGVALNAVANARILREAGFERVHVHPAAGDAGGALGAALLGAVARGDRRPSALVSAALGEDVDASTLGATAGALGLPCRRASDPVAACVERLLRGEVVAVAQGRFEWGPRALGQRSILALPADEAIRERLNRVVKRREPFRPFAPAVRAADAGRWFEEAANDMTPFMTTVARVRGDARASLPAVTHVDGTARVQTVTAASAPFLDAVLASLARAGAAPVVLNTSLNGPGEPIAGSALDALAFFAGHPVDAMLANDLVIERPRTGLEGSTDR